MAQLGGWKRIGIAVSVVWILGAGIFSYNRTMNYYLGEHRFHRWSSCLDTHPPKDWSDVCDQPDVKESTDKGETLRRDRRASLVVSAIVAFVPVPLGWGFVYLILFLVRWVKRGFRRPL